MLGTFQLKSRRKHLCPVHGWEVCYMDVGHGCPSTLELAGFWKSKTIDVGVTR